MTLKHALILLAVAAVAVLAGLLWPAVLAWGAL
jgi:hypothetical protein